ncbi:MAG: agmatinase, partial [Candidatus Anammoxibacter sp.]
KDDFQEYLTRSSPFGDFVYEHKSEQQIYQDSKVVIVGIPYDGTATYQSGSKYGPDATLKASVNIETFDEICGNIYDVGISTAGILNLTDVYTVPEKVVNRIYLMCKRLLDDDKFVVTIGGEHSITCGVVKAYKEKYGRISVLQLDAHLDLMDSYGGSKYNHACVMRRIIDDNDCRVVQVGARVISEEENNYIKQTKRDLNIFRAKDIYNNSDWVKQAIDSLGDVVYITIDLDVFDPSLMPATGTPVPGGLDWYGTLDFLSSVYKEKKVVGFDVTELKPIPGNEAPNFLTADLIYKNIGFYKEYVLKP